MAPAMTVPAAMTMRAPPHLAHDILVPVMMMHIAIAMRKRRQRRHRKKHGVHNGKRPRRLEHGARLVHRPPEPGNAHIVNPVVPDLPRRRRVRAVGPLDGAQEINARDERAEEAQVDEADEEGVVRRAAVGDEREEAPREGQDGDDEEDEDGVGGEDVCVVELGDEPAEHAHGGDLDTKRERERENVSDDGILLRDVRAE